MNLAQLIEAEARLFILQQLAAERDGRSTAERLRFSLREILAIKKPVEWVIVQLNFLGDMGAIATVMTAPALIVEIKGVGRAHLDGSEPIPGVKRAEA